MQECVLGPCFMEGAGWWEWCSAQPGLAGINVVFLHGLIDVAISKHIPQPPVPKDEVKSFHFV